MASEESIKEMMEKDEKYVEALETILGYEKNYDEEPSNIAKDRDRDCIWEYDDVGVHPTRLFQLNTNGVLDKVFDSNSTTYYCLEDRELTEEVLDTHTISSEGPEKEMHSFPDEDSLPDELFNEVVGYENVKWLLRRGLTTDKITNFLLVGPPGSAKTVFLMCIKKLGDAEFIPATDATSSGFIETMFEERPKYMLLDELDDMGKDNQSSLASYTETGILKETKYNKSREIKTNTKTLGSANNLGAIKDNIVDRFTVLEFDPYTKEEFIEVCEHILPMNEGKSKEEARTIAEEVYEFSGSGDVRQAIQVARLSRGDPQKVVDVLDEYSGSSTMEGLKGGL